MLIQLKLILEEIFRIWHGRYQPMQLYLWAGFSSHAQAFFFLICMGDSVGAGYRPRIIPTPDQDLALKVLLKVIRESLPLKLVLKVAFLLLKPKLYLYNKLVAFQQFSSNGKPLTLSSFDLESFLLIFCISRFLFFAIWHI